MTSPSRLPTSTYRLQFHRGFGFADACALVTYLAQLGITDCYSSPQLKARSGSTHGYDICDHSQLNRELGSERDYEAFTAALAANGLGQILDIVPNHMGADPQDNPWWRDVLENGMSSPFAEFFDIDWDPVKPELKGKVLLPVLGDQYGRVLERGELQLRFDRGRLSLHYGDLGLPINPQTAARALGVDVEQLRAGHDNDPAIQGWVLAANGIPGDRSSFDRLHALLEQQAYRLAYWRTAIHEINYRRFFDINELVGLRVEQAHVFEATHGLVKTLIARRQVTGLRVDHPDGLFDPHTYFVRLQRLAAEALDAPAPAADGRPFYVIAEKILSESESLRSEWPVSGTTGYSFLNLAAGLFVDPRAAKHLRRMYVRFTGRHENFEDLAYECKRIIMLTSMASELNVLAHALNRISEADRRHRDFTLESCRKALLEVIACFRVYRTYVSQPGAGEVDHAAVSRAITDAARRNPVMEASIFGFLRFILLPPAREDAQTPERLRFAMRFQQFTGPVQAKGVEDTAFYRYHVLVSANDVGGHPQHLGVSPETFHEDNRARMAQRPLELIATSTHDGKRGEDARVRIAALSELPALWRRSVSDWMRINASNRTKIDGSWWAPDRNDEYLFYQALLGAWPAEPELADIPRQAGIELEQRLSRYLQKAVREAKVHTSWIDENPAYGDAVARFVARSLRGRTAPRFLGSFVPFQRRIARVGMLNALSQLVLKLAAPGVTDIYQGSELWNLDLVDPDNRRPVDFQLRRRLLNELQPLIDRVESGKPSESAVSDLLGRWDDARIKLFVTACGLRMRRAHQGLMLGGAYLPLAADGPAAEHVVAFARANGSHTLLAMVPRLTASLTAPERPLPLCEAAWGTTRVLMPDSIPAASYRHVLTGEGLEASVEGGLRFLRAAEVFRTSPVALLLSE